MELHIRDVSKTYSDGVPALSGRDAHASGGDLRPARTSRGRQVYADAHLGHPAREGSIRLGDTDVLNQQDEVRKTLDYLLFDLKTGDNTRTVKVQN